MWKKLIDNDCYFCAIKSYWVYLSLLKSYWVYFVVNDSIIDFLVISKKTFFFSNIKKFEDHFLYDQFLLVDNEDF